MNRLFSAEFFLPSFGANSASMVGLLFVFDESVKLFYFDFANIASRIIFVFAFYSIGYKY